MPAVVEDDRRQDGTRGVDRAGAIVPPGDRIVTAPRIPTLDDYRAYNGAHCFRLWNQCDDEWRCPSCDRTKYQIMRWTKRSPDHGRTVYWGWMAGLHRHHDHGATFGVRDGKWDYYDGRFMAIVICDQCNAADGFAKRELKLPPDFTFTPKEIGEFVVATPHGRHVIDLVTAHWIYQLVSPGLGV